MSEKVKRLKIPITLTNQQKPKRLLMIDKYDFVILDIIQSYKKNHQNQLIKLSQLEANFWTRIERDDARHTHSAQLGERIAKLYLEGYLANRAGSGYTLTKKGKEELAYQSVSL
jgi:hypothetical protein